MTALRYTEGIPAIDHHSHAGYVRPGQSVAGVGHYLRENALGHVEGHIPHASYQYYMASVESGDDAGASALADQFGISELIARSELFQQTTVHAVALKEGCEALYGPISPKAVDAVSRQARIDDPVGLYDKALLLSGTASVLTDIPEIDATAWPHERYKPIARIDPYLFPFGHPAWTGRGTDAPRFRRIFLRVLQRQLELEGTTLPGTLDGYKDFVLASLTRRKAEGFVGLKIASAYVRTLEFVRTDVETATRAWSRLRAEADQPFAGREAEAGLTAAAHKELADHLAFFIAEWAVEVGLPMQIHTGFGHTEPGLRISTANPLLLEELLGDPALNALQVILIHGGFPYSANLTALAQMNANVHLDFSWMPYLHHHAVGRLLEEWLELLPADRVMFGTDTGSPEIHVAATRRARLSLDGVLHSGVTDGLWTPRQATWLAERVLHQNLCDVYGIAL
ncbi:amidohydrolase family protein [Georgenia faecalis]|uniref:amidohydrolase family protein n=1 Tax=Georgenia faecalis TaxID=2483799 RepID=UPI000FD944C0|nr:amidohydrolase family protein [Georgenia faecalis]